MTEAGCRSRASCTPLAWRSCASCRPDSHPQGRPGGREVMGRRKPTTFCKAEDSWPMRTKNLELGAPGGPTDSRQLTGWGPSLGRVHYAGWNPEAAGWLNPPPPPPPPSQPNEQVLDNWHYTLGFWGVLDCFGLSRSDIIFSVPETDRLFALCKVLESTRVCVGVKASCLVLTLAPPPSILRGNPGPKCGNRIEFSPPNIVRSHDKGKVVELIW